MEFEWDDAKDALNLEKHRIGFEEAIALFGDPGVIVVDATRDADGENRSKAIGAIEGRLFVAVFTTRGDVRRIISARRANRRETEAYQWRS